MPVQGENPAESIAKFSPVAQGKPAQKLPLMLFQKLSSTRGSGTSWTSFPSPTVQPKPGNVHVCSEKQHRAQIKSTAHKQVPAVRKLAFEDTSCTHGELGPASVRSESQLQATQKAVITQVTSHSLKDPHRPVAVECWQSPQRPAHRKSDALVKDRPDDELLPVRYRVTSPKQSFRTYGTSPRQRMAVLMHSTSSLCTQTDTEPTALEHMKEPKPSFVAVQQSVPVFKGVKECPAPEALSLRSVEDQGEEYASETDKQRFESWSATPSRLSTAATRVRIQVRSPSKLRKSDSDASDITEALKTKLTRALSLALDDITEISDFQRASLLSCQTQEICAAFCDEEGLQEENVLMIHRRETRAMEASISTERERQRHMVLSKIVQRNKSRRKQSDHSSDSPQHRDDDFSSNSKSSSSSRHDAIHEEDSSAVRQVDACGDSHHLAGDDSSKSRQKDRRGRPSESRQINMQALDVNAVLKGAVQALIRGEDCAERKNAGMERGNQKTQLPQGWKARTSRSTGKIYFYHTPTKTTQWRVPT